MTKKERLIIAVDEVSRIANQYGRFVEYYEHLSEEHRATLHKGRFVSRYRRNKYDRAAWRYQRMQEASWDILERLKGEEQNEDHEIVISTESTIGG
jgi:hypothetical protein